MASYHVISLLLWWILEFATAGNITIRSDDKSHTLSKEKNRAFLAYLSMPFHQLVCVPAKERRTIAYQSALFERREFRDIDWDTDNCVKLAKQLFQLQRDESDHTYHRSLNAITRGLMESQRLDKTRSATVMKILSTWIKARNKRRSDNPSANSSRNNSRREKRLQSKLKVHRETDAERRQGLGLPLILYLKNHSLQGLTTQEIHELALMYQEKYRSSQAFIANLTQLWKDLKIHNDDVYFQNHDPRNLHCKKWDLDCSRFREENDSRGSQCSTEKERRVSPALRASSEIDVQQEDQLHAVTPDEEDTNDLDAELVAHFSQNESKTSLWSFEEEDEPFLASNEGIMAVEGDEVCFPDWVSLS